MGCRFCMKIYTSNTKRLYHNINERSVILQIDAIITFIEHKIKFISKSLQNYIKFISKENIQIKFLQQLELPIPIISNAMAVM